MGRQYTTWLQPYPYGFGHKKRGHPYDKDVLFFIWQAGIILRFLLQELLLQERLLLLLQLLLRQRQLLILLSF